MDAKQTGQNLVALDRIRALIVSLRDAEEGVAMKGDLDDLLLRIDRLRRTMVMRGVALAGRRACGVEEVRSSLCPNITTRRD